MQRVVLVSVLVLVTTALASAQSQSMTQWAGTWKLNIARSKYDPGPPPAAPTANTTVLEIVNGVMRIITNTVNAQGQNAQVVRYAIFDGKEWPQATTNAAAMPTTYVYRWVDARTYEWTTRVSGQVTTTTRLVLSADGRTQTLTTTGTNAQGMKVNNVTIFEKQ